MVVRLTVFLLLVEEESKEDVCLLSTDVHRDNTECVLRGRSLLLRYAGRGWPHLSPLGVIPFCVLRSCWEGEGGYATPGRL